MSPLYESEQCDRSQLETIRQRGKCQVCGGWLNMFYDSEKKLAFVACADWPRSHHEGIEREASRYEQEGIAALNIEKRREIMVEEFGNTKTRALEKYTHTVTISREVATEIVETLWAGAPQIEKEKAIILCHTYQLNPLMKHLHLVGYRRKLKDGTYRKDSNGKEILDWSMMLGIGATRLMAQRKHHYSYLDMTPRKATKEEVAKILGDTAEANTIYGFTHIKDVDTGAEAFGLRGCKITDNIKGTEKGNTHLNMACIRSERLALDRQYPGEMPTEIDIMDERYIDVEDYTVDVGTGEIVEPTAEELPEMEMDEEEHFCEEHQVPFELKTGRGGSSWWSHKLEGGGWCNEIKAKSNKKAEIAPEPEIPSEPPESTSAPERDPDSIRTHNELLKACHEDFKMQPDGVLKELGVKNQMDIAESPSECYRRILAVRK